MKQNGTTRPISQWNGNLIFFRVFCLRLGRDLETAMRHTSIGDYAKSMVTKKFESEWTEKKKTIEWTKNGKRIGEEWNSSMVVSFTCHECWNLGQHCVPRAFPHFCSFVHSLLSLLLVDCILRNSNYDLRLSWKNTTQQNLLASLSKNPKEGCNTATKNSIKTKEICK